MEFKIKGEFNSGLKVYSINELLMFSEVKRNVFKDKINIYDAKSNLILQLKQSFNNFKIEQNEKVLYDINQINKKYIIFQKDKKIIFNSKWYSFSLYPTTKVYFHNQEIGIIKTKQLSLSIDMNLSINTNKSELVPYILVLLLCRFSNVDHE